MNTQIATLTHFRHGARVTEVRHGIIRNRAGVLASLAFAALLSLAQSNAAVAATAPNLGTTAVNGIVSSTFTNSNIAPQSIINGDVCFTTGPVTPPLLTTGTTATPCPPAKGADQGLALADLNGQACISLGAGAITLDSVIIGPNPPGTIPPGCYSSGGAMNVTATTTVTLSGAGVYVFRPGGALTTGANSRVVLAGGACANDVFWAPGAAATLGANAALSATPTFVGNILTAAGISIGQFANLEGRALAFGGTVTTNAVTITVPTCAPFVVPVVVNPTLAKAFSPITINTGGTSTLTVTLSNANAAVATLTGPLVDTLPGGVVVANTPNANTTCGGAGAVVAVAAASTVTLPAGRTIPANGTCTLTVDVTAALVGSYVNTLPIGALVTSNGNNLAPATATLTVIAPVVLPTLAKAFNPVTINVNGTSTLTVTLGNPNAAVATLTAPLVDTLPGGVVVANTPNANTTCGGVGAIVAVAAASSVTLPAGRTIPANGTCTLTVDVTSALVGSYVNTLPIGALVTSNGNNPAPANATLTVIAPVVLPTLVKAFNPGTINAGDNSRLTVTLGNPNATVATLTASLVDTLPVGVVIATVPNASTTCGGAGAPIATAGGANVTLPAGRSIPANGNCTLSVDVTSALIGSYLNTLAVGALVTSNGNNPAPANATLIVIAPAIATRPTPVPTLSEWAMIMLVGLLAIAGFAAIRKQEN